MSLRSILLPAGQSYKSYGILHFICCSYFRIPIMYQWFYHKLPVRKELADSSLYLLSDAEIRYIKKRENLTIFLSALIGAGMVLVLYLPQYFWPGLFPVNRFTLPFLAEPLEFSAAAMIYGMVLVFLEIVLLTFLNIYCTHEIAFAIGFINGKSKYAEEKKKLLLSIGQEKKNKEIHSLGLDPYEGLRKSSVLAMNTLFTLKATLSNLAFKLLIQRFMGRYAVREVMDLVGIPVFAFWNAWGTRKVLREARIIIMGQNYLDYFRQELRLHRPLSDAEKMLMYDTLQYVTVSKRDYHKNHYLLAKLIIEEFGISTVKHHRLAAGFYDRLKSGSEDFKILNEKILLLGFILDGYLSLREKKRIRKLREMGIVSRSPEEVDTILRNFLYGKGLP